jgi:tetratricopeptide (TPR) repeat protein
MSAWDLITTGRFTEAIESLSSDLSTQPSSRLYGNRGIAYLNLGRFGQAQQDFEAAEKASSSRVDRYLLQAGSVKWIQGLEAEAAKVWEDVVHDLESNTIVYTDAAGGVEGPCLLWFAGVRLGRLELCKIATKSLRKTLRSKRSSCRPAVVGRLVVGQTTAADVREAVSAVPILRERQLCQAEFYIAWASF